MFDAMSLPMPASRLFPAPVSTGCIDTRLSAMSHSATTITTGTGTTGYGWVSARE